MRQRISLLLCATTLALAQGNARADVIFDPGDYSLRREILSSKLDRIRELGATTVRLRVHFNFPQSWSLETLDAAVHGVERRGMEVLLTPTGWNDPTQVAMLGARYPDVHRWALWNEPDLNLPNARVYRQVFLSAQQALAATGHPPSETLVGETSPYVRPGFIRRVLPVKAAGWAHHPYILAGRIGWAELHRALGRMPLYITEFGIWPEQSPELAWRVRCRAERAGWIRGFAQYLLFDDGWGTGLYGPLGEAGRTLTAFQQGSCLFAEASENGPRRVGVSSTRVTGIEVGSNGNPSRAQDAPRGEPSRALRHYPSRRADEVAGRGSTAPPTARRRLDGYSLRSAITHPVHRSAVPPQLFLSVLTHAAVDPVNNWAAQLVAAGAFVELVAFLSTDELLIASSAGEPALALGSLGDVVASAAANAVLAGIAV